jgi:hypothetical protein
MNKTKVTVKDFEPLINKVFKQLESQDIYVALNHLCCNSCVVADMEKQDIENYVYTHSQSHDTYLETGELWLGHYLDDPLAICEALDSVPQLHWELQDENSKFYIVLKDQAEGLAEWEVLEGHEPSYELEQKILEANPQYDTYDDVLDDVVIFESMAESKVSTKH